MLLIGISREDVLWRSANGWPKNGVPYSQSALYSDGSGQYIDGYRRDCSGYVSMCGAMPTNDPNLGSWGGFSTTTFLTAEAIYEIGWNEIKPGDLLGKCGPNTAGNNGHIGLVVKRNSDGTYLVRDHGGSGDGKGYDERNVSWSASSGYKPYRFMGIDGVVPDLGYRQLAIGDYGFDVRLLQEALNKIIKAGLKVDRDFGTMTLQAVKAFQQVAFPQDKREWDGIVGPKTMAQIRARLTPPVPPVPPTVPPTTPPATPDLSEILERLQKLEANALTVDGAKVIVAEDVRAAIAEIRLVLPAK